MAQRLRYPRTWQAPPAGRVLALAAHPDDEVLSCGGVLALHARQEDALRTVVVTDGAAGDPDGRYPRDTYVELRRAESRAAAEILGIPSPEFWDFPDQGLGAASGLAERLARLLDEYRPTVVYGPSEVEMHPDHAALAEAFAAAAGRTDLRFDHYAYDSWVQVRPTHVIDIGPVWELKRRAVEEFRSQLAYNDYLYAIAGLNAARSVFLPASRHVEAFERIGRAS